MKNSQFIHVNRIEFAVTYHCSGKCIHCSVADKLSHPGPEHHVRIRKAAETIEWLAEHFRVSSVMTFGGEPLLYPEITCAIHSAARRCGIPKRQLITNGYFSKNEERIEAVSQNLADCGVNDLLLSVDAFHQQHIPIAPVYSFARSVKRRGAPEIRLQPAWLVNREHENIYNEKTRDILAFFEKLEIPVSEGNDIFMAGNAVRYLSAYYGEPRLNPSDTCGSMPYTEPLTDITSLSVNPNGDVMVCAFAIGNIYRESIGDIVERYHPYENELMKAVLTGGVSTLIDLAREKGVCVNPAQCYGICDVCQAVSRKIKS